MVGVAAYEGTVGEGAERSILILTALIGHKRLLEYPSVVAFLVELADLKAALGE